MDTRNNESDDDNDVPQLSAETFQALQEFYKEQEANLHSAADVEVDDVTLESANVASSSESKLFKKDLNTTFPEDWQMSQFWYDDATSNTLATLVKNLGGCSSKIACLSCPSVFRACGFSENVHLFEYDKRFAKFGATYFFYDYNFPENISPKIAGTYAVVIADPPFLSEECLEKVSITVKRLLRPDGKIILCTGAVMENKAAEFLGLKKTSYEPTHKKNLGNTFACFTNFDLEINNSDSQKLSSLELLTTSSNQIFECLQENEDVLCPLFHSTEIEFLMHCKSSQKSNFFTFHNS